MPSITLSQISWSTPDGRAVLSDLDLQFQPERTGIIGRNGVGKSTLVQVLAGLTRPDSGEVRIGGRLQFARYWSVFGSTIIDLTGKQDDPVSLSDGYTPIRHRLGFAYEDDCVTIGVTWRRDYQDTGDARSGNTFLLRLAFRNLGV